MVWYGMVWYGMLLFYGQDAWVALKVTADGFSPQETFSSALLEG